MGVAGILAKWLAGRADATAAYAEYDRENPNYVGLEAVVFGKFIQTGKDAFADHSAERAKMQQLHAILKPLWQVDAAELHDDAFTPVERYDDAELIGTMVEDAYYEMVDIGLEALR